MKIQTSQKYAATQQQHRAQPPRVVQFLVRDRQLAAIDPLLSFPISPVRAENTSKQA
jgi:hypothetical protein